MGKNKKYRKWPEMPAAKQKRVFVSFQEKNSRKKAAEGRKTEKIPSKSTNFLIFMKWAKCGGNWGRGKGRGQCFCAKYRNGKEVAAGEFIVNAFGEGGFWKNAGKILNKEKAGFWQGKAAVFIQGKLFRQYCAKALEKKQSCRGWIFPRR